MHGRQSPEVTATENTVTNGTDSNHAAKEISEIDLEKNKLSIIIKQQQDTINTHKAILDRQIVLRTETDASLRKEKEMHENTRAKLNQYMLAANQYMLAAMDARTNLRTEQDNFAISLQREQNRSAKYSQREQEKFTKRGQYTRDIANWMLWGAVGMLVGGMGVAHLLRNITCRMGIALFSSGLSLASYCITKAKTALRLSDNLAKDTETEENTFSGTTATLVSITGGPENYSSERHATKPHSQRSPEMSSSAFTPHNLPPSNPSSLSLRPFP